MRCCPTGESVQKELVIYDGGFTFKGWLTYCSGCGIVRPSTSVIFDGKRDGTGRDSKTLSDIYNNDTR
jgi:hypothetical protein